jgi:hypothetical protein
MIRILDIPFYLFHVLRPQYALNYRTMGLNVIYRYLLACLSPLIPWETHYEKWCRKYYALAGNDGSSVSVAAYLNAYYGTYRSIIFGEVQQTSVGMYTYGDGDPVDMYTYGDGDPVDMYTYGAGPSAKLEPSVIYIPQALKDDKAMYENFIADLNALLIFGVEATIKTY